MRKNSLLMLVFLTIVAASFHIVLRSPSVSEGIEAEEAAFVCPMFCENKTYTSPGVCPVCGMDLIKKTADTKDQHHTMQNAVIFVFDGVQIIDYAAPYEIFGQAHFNVHLVAETSNPIETSMGMKVTPHTTLDKSPVPDVLIIPGGSIEKVDKNERVLQWIKTTAAKSKYVLSVCNGAFLLAGAGLLDGKQATTFHLLLEDLKRTAMKTEVVSNRRFVDNGKIITTAGLTSGMDGSLHVLSKMLGKGETQRIALHMEYNWDPSGNFARAALPDLRLRSVVRSLQGIKEIDSAKLLSTEGRSDEWQIQWELKSKAPAERIMKRVDATLRDEKWTPLSGSTPMRSNWLVAQPDGSKWNGTVELQPVNEQANVLLATLRIKRS